MPDTTSGKRRDYAIPAQAGGQEPGPAAPRRDYAEAKRLGRSDERRYRESGMIPPHDAHEDPKHTMYLLGALVIFIVLIAGAFIFLLSQKGGAPDLPGDILNPPAQNQSPSGNQTPVCDDQCNLDLAKGSGDISYCKEVISPELQESCFEALSSDSFEACTSLPADKSVDCITAFAVEDSDMSLCELLADPHPCKLAIDPCYDSSDPRLCKAIYEEDPSVCAHDTDCLLEYSFSKRSTDSCDLIQDAARVAFCKAVLTSGSQCSYLPTTPQKDECYQLLGQRIGDHTICQEIIDKMTYGVPCLSEIAVDEADLDVCDQASLPLDGLWACYRAYSLGTGDIAGCERIHEGAPTNRFACAFEYAKKFGDPSACQVIVSTLGSRDTCYQGAIIYSAENLTSAHCGDVTDFNWRNKCFTEAAKKEADVTVCERISEDFARESCIDSYALYMSKQ